MTLILFGVYSTAEATVNENLFVFTTKSQCLLRKYNITCSLKNMHQFIYLTKMQDV